MEAAEGAGAELVVVAEEEVVEPADGRGFPTVWLSSRAFSNHLRCYEFRRLLELAQICLLDYVHNSD